MTAPPIPTSAEAGVVPSPESARTTTADGSDAAAQPTGAPAAEAAVDDTPPVRGLDAATTASSGAVSPGETSPGTTSPGTTSPGTTSPGTTSWSPARALDRVLALADQLEAAPSPRTVTVDLEDFGGQRVLVALRGRAVTVAPVAGQALDAGFSSDLARGFAERGLAYADGSPGSGPETDGRRGGTPEDHASDQRPFNRRAEPDARPDRRPARRHPFPDGGPTATRTTRPDLHL